jgi:hypothetical protein
VTCRKEWESLDGKLDSYKIRMGGLKKLGYYRVAMEEEGMEKGKWNNRHL